MAENALLNMLQSASNAAASNVSAPVDGIAWLLRKAGLPVPANPLMGSDWMAQQGLTKPVQQGAGQVAGETVGMLAPFAAAAKAPQIANALLQAERNALAPSTLGAMGQRGATVWHGSPHKFDAFDSSKIGTGEGAQAYGHGLYLAETPEVARSYRSAGADPSTFVPVRSIRDPAQMAATALERAGGDTRHAQAVLAQNAQSGDMTAGAALKLLKQRATLPESQYAGNMYKVDLPDEHIAKMLDWDKPLSQQAPEVQAAAQRIAGSLDPAARKLLGNSLPTLRGSKLYELLASDDSLAGAGQFGAAASTVMRQHGIPGIRYLDGGSRGAGVGSSNYVVFPGNENLLQILERNGLPVKGK